MVLVLRPRMPQASAKFPSAVIKTTMMAKSWVFQRRRSSCMPRTLPGGALVSCGFGRQHPIRLALSDVLRALVPQRQVSLGFLVQPLPLGVVENRLADDPPGGLGTEIILAVEAL